MARIVVTGTSARALGNWLPAFERLGALGHRVETLLFPHLPDPDHAGLRALPLPCLGEFPVPESLRRIAWGVVSEIATPAYELLSRDPPDALVLTTCHAGPERSLAGRLFKAPRRPVLVGCQHGTVQHWAAYWRHFSFDQFLVFGEAFRQRAPETLRSRVHAVGLPKLDAVARPPRPPFERDGRPILFAAQTTRTDDLIRSLRRLGELSGRAVHVRPHPEFPELFADSGLVVAGGGQPLVEQIATCSLVVTSGSTTVLEALVAGCPCAVLPVEQGDEYAAAGIVAETGAAEQILEIVRRQLEPAGRARSADFLAATVGVADGRAADRAAARIATFVEPSGSEVVRSAGDAAAEPAGGGAA